ncbi:hypothetical protein AAG906_030319 [Vitis piasezkii]
MEMVNYVPLPIRDDGDVRIMFTVVAQSPPPNTIEMYCQTSSIDYHLPSSFTTPLHIESIGPSQHMVENNTSSLKYMQSYDNDMEPIVRVDMAELFDEDDGNEDIMDMEDNENTENDASLLGGGEHDVPSPKFRELNWDVINSITDKDLIARTGLWNESDELFKGLRFESKVDLQYVKRYSICRNQHLIGCNWRLRACRRKCHGLFEITKYIGPHTCVYPKLSQDHSQLDSTFIAREVQNIVQSDHTISILALHQIVKDKFGYNVHYKRIWEAKRKAMIRIFGDWDESYQTLPRWLNILQWKCTFYACVRALGHVLKDLSILVLVSLYIKDEVTQREGICLISDRHARIQAAIRDPSVGWSPPYAHHRYCLRHVASNFNDKYKNKMLDTKKWTLAHDGGHRYGWMTTNIAECINGVLKGARMLPITALYVIKEDQDLQGLGMKWIGENQVLNCDVGFVNKRVTIGENVLTEGSLLTQPLNDIEASFFVVAVGDIFPTRIDLMDHLMLLHFLVFVLVLVLDLFLVHVLHLALVPLAVVQQVVTESIAFVSPHHL